MKINPKTLFTLMIEKRLTKQELAEKAGLSSSVIAGAFSGKGCYYSTLYSLADVLGVSPIDLLEYEDNYHGRKQTPNMVQNVSKPKGSYRLRNR